MIETRRLSNRALHRLPSPWIESYCHGCDTEIRRGDAIYLDTDGGLWCSVYCATSIPRPGAGGRVMERAADYLVEPGLCVTCADELNLPPNVHVGGYVCGHCRSLHPLSYSDAIKVAWLSPEPEAAGLMECPRCAGYGTDIRSHQDVDPCPDCVGSGLVRMTLERRVSWTFSQLAERCLEASELFTAAGL